MNQFLINMKQTISMAIVLMIASCTTNSTENKTENKLKMEVIAIHDEAMDRMGTMMSLKMELKTSIDSARVEAYASAISDLEAAHEEMMDWMRDFSKQFPHDPLKGEKDRSQKGQEGQAASQRSAEAERKLLEIEKEEAIALRDNINTAISNAEKLLGKQE